MTHGLLLRPSDSDVGLSMDPPFQSFTGVQVAAQIGNAMPQVITPTDTQFARYPN